MKCCVISFTAVNTLWWHSLQCQNPVVPPTVNSDAGESSDSAEVALDENSGAAHDDQPKSVDGDTHTLRRTMMLRIHLAGMP
jgi:hypothetical protein